MSDRRLEVAIIGASVAGLGAALALASAGHVCRIFERDAEALPDTPVDAFSDWRRPSVPQLRHSHAFLARLRNLLRDRFPGVYRALLEAGAEELAIGDLFAPEIDDRTPAPGDEDLVMLACRRATFDWALHRFVAALPGVEVHGGCRVEGLRVDASGAIPRVSGLRLASGHAIPADLVVDASGRHSRLGRWLRAEGLPEPRVEREAAGIFYTSRFYRRRAGFSGPRRDIAVAADLGYLKYAVFHGDANIFSITLAASPDDEAMRDIMTPKGFDAAAAALPAVQRWVESARPIGSLRNMAGLENVRRELVRDGLPSVAGLVLVGDSALHTNPLYGRGCTMALLHGTLLADAVALHPNELAELLLRLEARVAEELVPWYDLARNQDRDAIATARAHREGRALRETRSDGSVDPKGYMRALIRDGVLPAMRRDAVVARRGFRSFHMLDDPGSLMRDPDIMRRVLGFYQTREGREKVRLGPSRAEFLDRLGALRV